MSCKELYLVLHRDKAVLCPRPSLLPKGCRPSTLTRTLSFVLYALSQLILRKYPYTGRGFKFIWPPWPLFIRSTDSFSVVPDGPRKGQAASSTTISTWVCQVISRAYAFAGQVAPFPATVHSTRAFCNSVSVAQTCKAAIWWSVHTFTKFHRVYVLLPMAVFAVKSYRPQF